MVMNGQSDEKKVLGFSTDPGELVIIQISGELGNYIGEVVSGSPFIVKVQERGAFARIDSHDFILLRQLTRELQEDWKNGSDTVVRKAYERGVPLVSGLQRLGIERGLHRLAPSPT